MLFIKVDNVDVGAQILFEEIQKNLATKARVLWLVTGGSNIAVAADIFKRLPEKHLPKLSVLLTDERFGTVGHADSNYQQLQEAGFDFSAVTSVSILNNASSLDEARDRFEQSLNKFFAETDIIIGQFGMGADGHTAGILPNSSATDDTTKLAVAYVAADYTRITMTFSAIKMVDKIYLVVFGQDKLEALKNLQEKTLSLATQPAQIFRQTKEAYIISNMIGDVK